MVSHDTRADRGRALCRVIVAVLILGAALCALLATNGYLPLAGAKPPTGATDSRGFVNSPARCDGPQTAVLIGRTAVSLVAICTDGRGHYEYRGMRLRDGALLKLPAKPMAGGCFGARTEQMSYTVSAAKLLLTAGPRVIRDETMLEFKDYRIPDVAPVVKTSG